jgi:integrase
MSVFKITGSPYYQFDFYFRGRRCRGSTKLTNKIAAHRYENNLREKLAKQRGGILDPEPPPCLKPFADQFLDRTKNAMRPSTSRCYGISLKNLRRFHSKRLDEITADEIESFKQSRGKEGKSPSTINRDLGFLRRVLLYGVKTDKIATTPFVAHKVAFLEEHRRERVLSFMEERAYLAAATQPLRDVAVLIFELGMRPGEVFSIRREDIHFHASPPFLHVPFGKTKNAVRDVPLTDRAMEVLRRRVAEAQKEKGEYIFPLRVGNGHDSSQPMNEAEPAHVKALLASKVTPPFRLYDCRHTYGTRAIEGGTDPLTLMRLMGHADLKTTSRYVHLSKQHLGDAQMRIERHRAAQEIAEVELREGEPRIQ